MELKTKGESVYVAIEKLVAKLSWTVGADFDLAAVWVPRTGEPGLTYFGEKGDMNSFPFMQLDKDSGVGDKAGANEETLRITKLTDMKYVYIVCWDYKAVQSGSKARFAGTDVKLVLTDNTGTSHQTKLDTGDMGNVAVVATIDTTDPIGPKLVNTSKVGTLKKWDKTAFPDLLAIVNAP